MHTAALASLATSVPPHVFLQIGGGVRAWPWLYEMFWPQVSRGVDYVLPAASDAAGAGCAGGS